MRGSSLAFRFNQSPAPATAAIPAPIPRAIGRRYSPSLSILVGGGICFFGQMRILEERSVEIAGRKAFGCPAGPGHDLNASRARLTSARPIVRVPRVSAPIRRNLMQRLCAKLTGANLVATLASFKNSVGSKQLKGS